MSFFAIILFLLSTRAAGAIDAAPENHLARANAQGYAGETNSLFLTPPGFFLNPYYNDVAGGTDKLLTASIKVGLLLQGENGSYELMARWRFLTPAFQHAFGHARDVHPAGCYADWGELSQAYARLVPIFGRPLKLQGTLGVNHVGNKGAKLVHTWIHKVTNNQTKDLEYTDQPEGRFLNGGFLVALPVGAGRFFYAPGLGFDTSKFLTESYAAINAVVCMRCKVWEMAGEVRIVAQHHSGVYDAIRPFRYEVAFGTSLWNRFKPTVKYVSAYLQRDPIGQTYFDFINLQIPF